ncbi:MULTISPECIES: hypothetical protein [unclassified Rhodococcus (in: high G+C Gram-positive bacteria)]|jgi:hypothetical protein|uniref:hypothetical protein n=1 Tax=unclassified Rhodococcus (in: high G+C Gram-positive bacteria) TaxID=192944 RepID=UPI001469ABCF|nr:MULTISPECIES: hypothetical protein [unclassified Rhodococcus (in: high G+C Gram-positive bacteria)]MBF0661411.1 hypothetical protein [Rhodococcus sp. (in: high G+C Gram-positive bacteria)]NMD94975.1 hypothetical protein [Rhodococcus sp. BL-253-APC-6A1W]
MRAALCNTLFTVFGHRICCGRIPEWTAYVGQEWDTYHVAPWNLYNVIWRIQNWIRGGVD